MADDDELLDADELVAIEVCPACGGKLRPYEENAPALTCRDCGQTYGAVACFDCGTPTDAGLTHKPLYGDPQPVCPACKARIDEAVAGIDAVLKAEKEAWATTTYKGHLLAQFPGSSKVFILAPREDALLVARPDLAAARDFVDAWTEQS